MDDLLVRLLNGRVTYCRGFLNRLSDRFPAIAQLRGESEKDNGETLPTVVMGEAARQAIAWHEEQSPEATRNLRRLATFLEEEFAAGSKELQDLIAVGFLESLVGPPESYWRIRENLGPRLRNEIEAMWPSG